MPAIRSASFQSEKSHSLTISPRSIHNTRPKLESNSMPLPRARSRIAIPEDEDLAGVQQLERLVLDPFPGFAHVDRPLAEPGVAPVHAAHAGGLPFARGLVLQVRSK